MANSVDVVLLRNRRRRRRRILKLSIVLVIAGIILLIYVKRDLWFPQLEGIGSRYQNVARNEEAEAEGVFELNISGGIDYETDFINNNLFILYDKYLYIYSTDGTELDRRQHAYGNALMEVAGNRALIYSSNGTSFRVDSANKMIYEETVDYPILFATISNDGYVGIVTESDTYACRLNIYDPNGNRIYKRECVERLMNLSFYGNGCIFSTISASDGELQTSLQYITFDSDSVQWETDPLSTLSVEIYALPDGGAFVIGDTKAAYYSSTGALVGSYDYNAALTDYAYLDGKAAVLLKNEERRQSVLMLFSDRTSAPECVSFDSILKNVIIDDETVYVLGGGQISSFAFSGQEMKGLTINDAYERILKYGKYFYLLGYDKIHRTEIN
ncbi:MAG: hypothetical protein IJ242_11515 [Clostridia bacterium]|nr:hypothetical protein [Clostridia bacterium]